MKPKIILDAEDDSDDAVFFRWALEKACMAAQLMHVQDGQMAMGYLAGVDPFLDRNRYPLPAVAVLDMRMPKASGFEVLEWIRQRPEIKTLPVVMLTDSESPGLRAKAMELGANQFFLKPSRVLDLCQIIAALPNVGLADLGDRHDPFRQPFHFSRDHTS